jgi:hypothetical protein
MRNIERNRNWRQFRNQLASPRDLPHSWEESMFKPLMLSVRLGIIVGLLNASAVAGALPEEPSLRRRAGNRRRLGIGRAAPRISTASHNRMGVNATGWAGWRCSAAARGERGAMAGPVKACSSSRKRRPSSCWSPAFAGMNPSHFTRYNSDIYLQSISPEGATWKTATFHATI